MALESWFTRPSGLPFPLALGGALFLLARRRARWGRLPERDEGWLLAAVSWVAAAGLLGWARLTGVADLAIESLALLAVGYAAARKGVAGARVVAVPAIFLLLALSPSPAAVNELFWFIQVHTAQAAAQLVEGFGVPVLRETVILTTPERTFAVIESCASLGVMVILVAIALLLRERSDELGVRSAWWVVAAVPLSVVLNLVRVVAIVLWPETNRVSHLVQWGVLIGSGSGLLVLAMRGVRRVVRPATGPCVAADARLRPRLAVTLGLAGLVGVSLLSRPPSPAVSGPSLAIPLERAGWRARELAVDRVFLGWVQFREIVSRIYERESDQIGLFVGLDDSRARIASPFSSKTLLPGFRWVEVENAGAGMQSSPRAETAIVAWESTRWWVTQWRLGYHGVLGEAVRHALAIDASPFTAPRIRAVVRVRVPLVAGDPEARAVAAAMVERFLGDFREFLPLPPEASALPPDPDRRFGSTGTR